MITIVKGGCSVGHHSTPALQEFLEHELNLSMKSNNTARIRVSSLEFRQKARQPVLLDTRVYILNRSLAVFDRHSICHQPDEDSLHEDSLYCVHWSVHWRKRKFLDVTRLKAMYCRQGGRDRRRSSSFRRCPARSAHSATRASCLCTRPSIDAIIFSSPSK